MTEIERWGLPCFCNTAAQFLAANNLKITGVTLGDMRPYAPLGGAQVHWALKRGALRTDDVSKLEAAPRVISTYLYGSVRGACEQPGAPTRAR